MGQDSQANPGTVLRLSDETIQVATRTRDVVIGALTTLRGEEVQLRDVVPVTAGERMPRLEPTSTAQLEALHRHAAAQEGYWERRLKKLQPIAFPVRRTSQGNAVSARIGKQVLRMPSPTLGEGVQVTGNTMLAAFVLYLHRVTSQSEFDLSFQAEMAAPGLETTGWFFTSRVPIRVSLDPDLSFAPFSADICGQLRAQQDRGPLCADLSTRVPELRNGVPPLRALKIGIKRVPCIGGSELSLEGVEFDALIPDDGRSMEWRYDELAVCRDDVERMAAEFATLVEAIHKRPTEPVWQHTIVPSEERDAMREWNDTAAPYPDDRCIHQLFEEQVVRTPNAIAVVFEGEELTYQQLNRRANRLAHHLMSMGIGPEVMVGLYLERSIEMMIGMLAILKAGGAYVPLDPAYPAGRLAYILEDTQAPVLLTLTSLSPQVPDCSAQIVCIDREFPAGLAGDFGDPEVGVEPDSLIYVIHTSGSTGRPKGVLVNHRSVCNFVYWKQQAFPLRCEDRVLQRITFSFDASVWAFFGPLIAGARIVLAPPERHHDISQLVKLIETSGVTTMKMVPSLLRLLTDHGGLERCKALRRIYSGGEPLKSDLRDRLLELTNAEVLNIYGPTEATIDVTYWCCERGVDEPVVPIGRPVSNVQLHILDERGQRVPIGVAGELHIGGICLARGYLNLPELTRENFIPDPFQEGSDMRLYRTGDLGRWRTDGSIEFLGRRDNQVKLHGFRIEPQEIESVLEAHNQVRTAVVSVREDNPGAPRLVAYIVPAPGQDPRAWELQDYLRASLPTYMVPSSYVTQEALPTGPNGKVDRNAFPAPNRDRPDLRAYAEPDTPEEAALERVWADVLGLDRVGVLDDFFDLGGNSVLSLEIVSGTRRELGIQLPIAKLFQYPQIRSLANYLSSGDRGQTMRTETRARARRQREALRRRRFQEAERR